MKHIDKSQIKIHPISSERENGLLYFYQDRLFRSPSRKYAPILEKAASLHGTQDTVLTDLKFNFDGFEAPVYEHKIYKHRVRIQELPFPQKKEMLMAICDLNIEAIKKGIIARDIHEGNFHYTIDGIKFVDMTGFDTIGKGGSVALDRIGILTARYLGKLSIPNLDPTKEDAWVAIKDELSKMEGKELHTTHWFKNYSHNMDIMNPINAKAECVWDLISELDDVETVLDVASNKGYYTMMVARKVSSAIGFEIDESCVNFAINYNKQHKLPAVFSNATIQSLIKDELYEHDRYASDLVMALAIVHHLHKKVIGISHEEFGGLLVKYSKKYIILEEITKEHQREYEKILSKHGFKVISRYYTGPDERHTTLYKKQ